MAITINSLNETKSQKNLKINLIKYVFKDVCSIVCHMISNWSFLLCMRIGLIKCIYKHCSEHIFSFPDPPKIPTDTPKNTSVIESRKAILPCPAYGTPPPIIEWYKDGVLLTGNEIGVRILGDGSLVFDSTQASDAGAYECVARNVAGNWSHVIEFKVYGKSNKAHVTD